MNHSERRSRASMLRGALVAACGVGALLTASAASAAPSVVDRLAAPALQTKAGEAIPLAGGGTTPGIAAVESGARGQVVFATPVGGKATRGVAPKRPDASMITLRRADGTVYATAVREKGRYDEMAFFDAAGKQVMAMYATVPEPAEAATEHAAHDSEGAGHGSHQRMSTRAALSSSPQRTRTGLRGLGARKGPAKPAAPRSSRNGRQSSNAYCSPTGSFLDNGTRIYGGAGAFYVSTNMPSSFLTPVLYAADNWNVMQNWCNVPDQSTAQFSYLGPIAVAGGYNGYSTIDFGPVSAFGGVCTTPGTAACAMTFVGTHPYLSEADIRLNNTTSWFINSTPAPPPPNALDVEGAATHEIGHAFGLGHVSSPAEVMKGAGYGSTADRKLGPGETYWANTAY
ncbi:matrixin family metalloprotease [Miltoncostaea oceani]|uniref:matrixin family metalloprotease n=1 Tax=Miltoncostaea oceani TaxID=2843216 RepID=UPI001C3DE971|nr:matrixin family metalloprotease [Miltoncostaea oceani]